MRGSTSWSFAAAAAAALGFFASGGGPFFSLDWAFWRCFVRRFSSVLEICVRGEQ